MGKSDSEEFAGRPGGGQRKINIKVCYFTHASNLTGASRSLIELLCGCGNYGIEPIVVLRQRGPLERELEKSNIQYIVIPHLSNIGGGYIKNVLKRIYNRFALKRVCLFLEREGVDLVHNNSLFAVVGMEAAERLELAYICHLRDFMEEDHNVEILDKEKQRRLISRADAVITISRAVGEKYTVFAPDAQMTQIYDGIKASAYLDVGHNIFVSQKVRILLAGRIQAGKGQLEAIKAVEWLRGSGYEDLTLTIVGSVGSEHYVRELERYIGERQMSDAVEIRAFVQDLKEIRGGCDIGLTCSRLEAMGRVTLENMLAGLLVIGANTAGTSELIEDGVTGLLYNQGDYMHLASTIAHALGHRAQMRAIAQRGRDFALNFSAERQNAKVFSLYKKVLGADGD